MSRLMIFAALITVTFGCRCAPPTFNRRLSYCKADFTVKGWVFKYEGTEKPKSSEHLHKKYLIWPSEFYRNPDGDWKSMHFYTPDGCTHCEVNLKVNGTYIFNGRYVHDQYIINKCEWVEDWDSVPNWAKNMLPEFYQSC